RRTGVVPNDTQLPGRWVGERFDTDARVTRGRPDANGSWLNELEHLSICEQTLLRYVRAASILGHGTPVLYGAAGPMLVPVVPRIPQQCRGRTVIEMAEQLVSNLAGKGPFIFYLLPTVEAAVRGDLAPLAQPHVSIWVSGGFDEARREVRATREITVVGEHVH